MSEDPFDSLESRFARLERLVLGDEAYPDNGQTIVETLTNSNSTLDALRAARENIAQGMSRVDELDSLLAWEDEGDSGALAASRAEAVLTCAETISHRLRQMNQLSKAAPVLESLELAQVSEHAPRLAALAAQTVQDSAQGEEQSEEVRQLLDRYNQLTNQLSRTFSQWDAAVTEAELLANPPKPRDS